MASLLLLLLLQMKEALASENIVQLLLEQFKLSHGEHAVECSSHAVNNYNLIIH